MLKHQSRPTSILKINSKDSITTTTMENRETTTIEKKKRINYSYYWENGKAFHGVVKQREKCFTGWYRLTSIGLNNLLEHEK